MLTGQQVLPN